MIHVIQQSCLEKIKADTRDFNTEYLSASALSNEDFAYQIVLYSDEPAGESATVELRGNGLLTIHEVKQVPVNWPHYSHDRDPQYLSDVPTLLPDALIRLGRKPTLNITENLTVLWIGVRISMPGEHLIDLYLNGEQRSRFVLEILPHTLAKANFTHCEYIDPCSISKYYGLPMFSSEHWQMLGKYFNIAAEHGVNCLLTPLYPPVYGDLPMGSDPVQLFAVTRENNQYQFNFDLLDSWISVARKNNIKNFTFPPLIPSFKTLKCPEVKMRVGYRECNVFDESVNVLSGEFSAFIRKFLMELIDHLKAIGVFENVTLQFAHAPSVEDAANYKYCRNLFNRIPWGNQIADTMVPTEFLDLSLGSVPFFSSAKAERYFKYEFGRYLYLDIFDPDSVISNLIAAPSMYIRGFGALAYSNRITALFSLWFNNFITSDSKKANVIMDTSNENSLPSGNGFLVYPGPKGPIPTVRLKQLYFALQDNRVLDKLNHSIPFERIQSRIDKKYKILIDKPMISKERFLDFREEIYSLFDK